MNCIDGNKRKRRQFGNGRYDKVRAEWYAKHRALRFARRFGMR